MSETRSRYIGQSLAPALLATFSVEPTTTEATPTERVLTYVGEFLTDRLVIVSDDDPRAGTLEHSHE